MIVVTVRVSALTTLSLSRGFNRAWERLMTRLILVLAIFAFVGAYTPVAGADSNEGAAVEATDGADDVAAPANPCGGKAGEAAEATEGEAAKAATDEEEVPAAPKPE